MQELAPEHSAPAVSVAWWRSPAFASLVPPVLAVLIIALIFIAGLRRGMDHVVEEIGLAGTPTAIAIALSDQIYGLNAGYLAYATVLDKLDEIWTRGTRLHDATQFANDANRDLLNEGIQAAAALGPQQPGFVSEKTLVTMVNADLGCVDFVKLSFRLFGLRIESFYYTFLLLLALSSFAYLIVFRSEPVATAVLLCTLFAFFIELHTTIFTPHIPTFFGTRHGSTLALIPAWHFAFLVLHRRPASLLTVLATLVQLAIMLLGLHIRSSATWVVLFVLALAIVLALLRWRHLPSQAKTWLPLVRAAAPWPVLLLIAGFFAYGEYTKAIVHPVYNTDDATPYHGMWHNAFMGLLATSPELVPDGKALAQMAAALGNFDQPAYTAAARYLNDSHFMPLPKDFPASFPPGYLSPLTGLKFRLDEQIMQRVVLGIFADRPLDVLEAFVYKKPLATVDQLRHMIGDSPGGSPLWLVIVGGLATFGVIYSTFAEATRSRLWPSFLMLAAAWPFAALPNLWVYPFPRAVADVLLTSLVLLQLVVCAAVLLAVQYGLSLSRFHHAHLAKREAS